MTTEIDSESGSSEICLSTGFAQAGFGLSKYLLKGLILAQNERWRHGLGMQVERV